MLCRLGVVELVVFGCRLFLLVVGFLLDYDSDNWEFFEESGRLLFNEKLILYVPGCAFQIQTIDETRVLNLRQVLNSWLNNFCDFHLVFEFARRFLFFTGNFLNQRVDVLIRVVERR